MNKWLLSGIAILVLIFSARYVVDLQNENAAIEKKLVDDRNRIDHLKLVVAEDERKLDMQNLEGRRRLENLNELIVAKQKDLQGVEARLETLKKNPDLSKAKQDAVADLKLQKDKIDSLENHIRSLDESIKNLKSESHDDESKFEERFRNQDTNLGTSIKAAEDTLRALEIELKAIKIIRNDPVAINERNTKVQEIVNQKTYLSDLRRQKRELVSQHAIQKNNLNSSLTADQSQVNNQIVTLRTQLKDEKARYDLLDKTLKSFANSEQGIRNQTKFLQDQKQVLEREISELKTSNH